MALTPEARHDIEQQLAKWVSTIRLPAVLDLNDPALNQVIIGLVFKYGPEAVDALKDSAERLLGQGKPPRSLTQHWLQDQAREARA